MNSDNNDKGDDCPYNHDAEPLEKHAPQSNIFEEFVSVNEGVKKILQNLPDIARNDCTVLIEGESGTGKELIARAIHARSQRRDNPMITVNCGAIPDTLLESELFGYKAGAFTDAKKDKPGRFALAEGGTIFLDEIGDISPALQVSLLRVIQDGIYEPLGSTKSEQANVRIIAATNKDLSKLIQEGKFRDDLFYRINVMKISLPPLRSRREDIPILIEHFIKKFGMPGESRMKSVSTQCLKALLMYDYPGNIRQLENIIQSALVSCHGEMIEMEHLPRDIFGDQAKELHSGGQTLKEMEAALIRYALEKHGWNRVRTARELGISRVALWRRIKKYDIKMPNKNPRK